MYVDIESKKKGRVCFACTPKMRYLRSHACGGLLLLAMMSMSVFQFQTITLRGVFHVVWWVRQTILSSCFQNFW